jgi:hypothetical protein
LDLFGTIQELHAERKKIVELIRAMEELQQSSSFLSTREKTARRRGRKSMDAAERQRVSERMKKYWASRRSAQEERGWAAAG